jgi:dihydroorotate dehydrogenase subfamily 1
MADVDLSIEVNGMLFENPFVLGSGPPGTNARVIAKSFELGWGGCVIKTISLDATKVVNTAPRYGKLKSRVTGEVIGFENIELISDRPFDTWIDELIDLKKRYPKKMLIASIMEEYDRAAWHEIVERTQATGIDAFELNLSCPHGLPERRMGMAMGENPDLVAEVVGWVKEVSTVPVWAKMTPNIGNPAEPALAAMKAGADGISAINTILSIIGIDLKTLRPMPTVEGYAVAGGYSGQSVRPIALRHVMEIARAQPGVEISGIGGIETGEDVVQFLLVGASTVQVCTGAMLQGYKMVSQLEQGVKAFMREHGFTSLRDFVGKALDAFTTHADLVARQAVAKAGLRGQSNRDAETWKGDIASETDKLTVSE